MTQPLNLLIDEFASSQNYQVDIKLGILESSSESGLSFTIMQQYIPDVILNLSLRLLKENDAKAIVNFFLDNRGKTFPFDLTDYRVDYNGSNLLIRNSLSGVQHVRLAGDSISYKPMSEATNLHEMSFQLQLARNIIA